jgi:hypothetical protein
VSQRGRAAAADPCQASFPVVCVVQVSVLWPVMKTHMQIWWVPRKELIDLQKVSVAHHRFKRGTQQREEAGELFVERGRHAVVGE